ncbi:MAG: metal-dependent transcriptional regulator, partial [Spirochaetota bacterium]
MSVDSRHKSSAESYMKHIVKYMSEQSKNSIGTGDLSRLIGVTPGSATSMLKKLAADGYLQYRPHRGCTLTGKGRLFGIAMLRRHRLLETFLVKTLHYDPAEVHDEAERLE